MTVERDAEIGEQKAADSRSAPVVSDRAAPEQLYPHLRRNYVAHAIEGGLFMGGLNFVNANTLLPTMVQTLNGPAWLVSLMPSALWLAYALPLLFTAHWIDRLHRYKPLLLAVGILQRVPFLFAAIGLMLGAGGAGGSPGLLALVAVASAPFLSGIMGGTTMTAWQQFVIKTIPENRRSSLFAVRYLLSCIIGIGAGFAVERILAGWPQATAYAILHLCIFAFLMASYAVFATIREPDRSIAAASGSPGLIASLAAIPRLLRSNRPFALYLIARFFRNGLFIITPFLAIYARKVLHSPESYLGQLLLVQNLGAIVGNLLAGFVGDRLGGKITMLGGCVALAALSAWAAVARGDMEFQLIFFLYGVGYYASEVGTQILVIELSPAENRSMYLAIGWLINLPAMLLASWLSTKLWEGHEHMGSLSLATVMWMLLAMAFLVLMREPRKKGLG